MIGSSTTLGVRYIIDPSEYGNFDFFTYSFSGKTGGSLKIRVSLEKEFSIHTYSKAGCLGYVDIKNPSVDGSTTYSQFVVGIGAWTAASGGVDGVWGGWDWPEKNYLAFMAAKTSADAANGSVFLTSLVPHCSDKKITYQYVGKTTELGSTFLFQLKCKFCGETCSQAVGCSEDLFNQIKGEYGKVGYSFVSR